MPFNIAGILGVLYTFYQLVEFLKTKVSPSKALYLFLAIGILIVIIIKIFLAVIRQPFVYKHFKVLSPKNVRYIQKTHTIKITPDGAATVHVEKDIICLSLPTKWEFYDLLTVSNSFNDEQLHYSSTDQIIKIIKKRNNKQIWCWKPQSSPKILTPF